MGHTINNRETNEGDKVHFIDHAGQMHDATIKSIEERDNTHYAVLDVDGQEIADVPHNTSPESHSWNHTHEPLTPDELKRYGYEKA